MIDKQISGLSVCLESSCVFTLQCTVNGVNYEKLPMGGGLQKTKLEIFFFGFPRIVGMRHFPNLTYLCVMNQKIEKLSGLETCKNLEELWVCEGVIAVSCTWVCEGVIAVSCAWVCEGVIAVSCAWVCEGVIAVSCAWVCEGVTAVSCAWVCEGVIPPHF